VRFEEELREVLPSDLPRRDDVAVKAAQHLRLIEEANRHFNLTRITEPREAAIKHVLDCVMPWRLFSGAGDVMDAGTGAGFPGIPLALVLPDVRFTLTESIQKKARFVDTALIELELPNVTNAARRAEELSGEETFDVITTRALAPISRTLALFAPALKRGTRMLLYKGPDVEQEIEEAAMEARKRRVRMEIVMRYELPESSGVRTIIDIHPDR